MSKENNNPCGCNCNISEDVDSSKRDFIKRATAITVIGGTAFILEACGGGGSPTGPEDNNGDDNGGGSGGGDNGGGSGGDTGYNYDPATGTITIDISKIYTTLQTVGFGIMLASNITFDDRGIIVLRTSGNSVKALSRRCTHQGQTVNMMRLTIIYYALPMIQCLILMEMLYQDQHLVLLLNTVHQSMETLSPLLARN